MKPSDGLQQQKILELKAIRQQLGWSQEHCAHQLGVTYSSLHRWERGETFPRSRIILDAIDILIAKHAQNGESDLDD